MVDYRVDNYIVDGKEADIRINPNDYQGIVNKRNELYMQGLIGTAEERLYFSNANLMTLGNGPGSTQKPLVWLAVTSGVDIGSWESLAMAKINTKYVNIEDKKYFRIPKFNDVTIPSKTKFQSLASDEGFDAKKNITKDVNLVDFISQSSNYYNAMMVYIGSFTKEQLKRDSIFGYNGRDSLTLFRKLNKNPNQMNSTEYFSSFPIMKIKVKGKEEYYSFNREIDSTGIKRSILHEQFEKNFRLDSTLNFDKVYSLYPSLASKVSTNYVYPDRSVINLNARIVNDRPNDDNDLTNNAIRFTAIGASKVWEVSPIKMAEMYGIAISRNKSYTLTIEPGDSNKYESIESETKANVDFYKGLSSVFTDEKNGTAREIYNEILRDKELKQAFEEKKYFIYGKTGTIDNSFNRRSKEDHLLAVVITNKDLTDEKNITKGIFKKDVLKDMKFYVIYICQNNYRPGLNCFSIHAKLIKEVMNSECFKSYMSGK